ncbi:MAG: PHP domain-containing protein [Bacillota bacterium]
MKADLHVHTALSDSSYTIEETIQKANQKGVGYLGIVNHDTVAGLEKAQLIGKKAGIKVIPGIEISAFDFKRKRKVHILGYNFDLKAPNIRKLCDPLITKRNNHSLWQIKTLIENGFKITLEEVLEKAKNSTCIYKQHIMAVLLDKGYCSEIYCDLYFRLFKNQGICAGDIAYVDAFQAVQAVKLDGGKAVLAHPGQLNSYEIMEELLLWGLDGVEMYHEDHDFDDHQRILAYGTKHGMILTGGSDFHGIYGGTTEIGGLPIALEYLRDLI